MINSIFNSHQIFQVAEFCPRALFTYLFIEKNKDENCHLIVSRQVIVNDMSLSWTRFVNDVKALARLGILEWHQSHDNLQIILAEEEIEEFEC